MEFSGKGIRLNIFWHSIKICTQCVHIATGTDTAINIIKTKVITTASIFLNRDICSL